MGVKLMDVRGCVGAGEKRDPRREGWLEGGAKEDERGPRRGGGDRARWGLNRGLGAQVGVAPSGDRAGRAARVRDAAT